MKNTLLRIYGQCNFRCKLCMASDFNAGIFGTSLDKLKEQILQAKEDGVGELDIGGGEPTMYPHLLELLDFAYQNKIRCAICTNGFKFFNIDYVKKILKFRPIGIKISFHSHKEDTFDFITGIKGSYRTILQAIDNVMEQLEVYPTSKNSYILANIVVNRYNFRDLLHIVKFLHSRRVYVIKISQLVLSGSVYSNSDLLISPAEVQPYLKKAVTYLNKNKIFYYYIDKFPICILESEYKHFVPLNDTSNHIKLKPCLKCPHNQKCCGISKLSLIATYGKQLLKSKSLFPKNFFGRFFINKDISLIKKL